MRFFVRLILQGSACYNKPNKKLKFVLLFYTFMRFIFRFFTLLIFLLPTLVSAQSSSAKKIPRVLFLLDGSSSMAENWAPDKTRFQQAGKFIIALMDSLGKANSEVEFGLRVFGHQYPAQQKNCYDTKLEIKFSRYNTGQMEARLDALHGYGVSPIAFSLSEAANEDFENENKYAYSIVLITDGGESCNGDICKVVNDLLQRKIFFRPYIVSLLDYAPLKDLYACLGTFLTVSKEAEMPPTINKIVDAHREGFVRAKTGTVISVMPEVKKPDTIVIPIKIKEPVKKPAEPTKVDTIIIPIKIKQDTLKSKPAEPAKPIVPPQVRDKREFKPIFIKQKLKVFREIPDLSPMPKLIAVPPFRLSEVGNAPKETPVPKETLVPKEVVAAPVVKPVVEERKKLKEYARLSYSKLKPFRNSLVVLPAPKSVIVPSFVLVSKPDPVVVSTETPVLKPVIPIAEKPVEKPVVKVIEKPIEKPVVRSVTKDTKKKEVDFLVEKTPASETMLEVYFTDGNGKFYPSSPQVLLSDPVSNKAIHQFYRVVNPSGNPDPIKTTAGTYNLTIVGSDNTFIKDLVISPNMLNKVVITVNNGSLQFAWRGLKERRPVDKYEAVVKRNFVAQPSVQQRCDTILPYPPGNYHIEINTLPVTRLSVDLTFGAMVVIPVDFPGRVQISNTNSLGKAMIYYQLGDRFVQLKAINVTGEPASQTLELKPGIYEVHFVLGAGLPEKVLIFHINSGETMPIELQ